MKFNSPIVQTILLGFVCLCCPGMYNVMNSLGIGGQLDAETSKKTTLTLYSFFGVFSIFGGIVYNALGSHWCLFSGGLTYALNSVFLLYYINTKKSVSAIIFSAALGAGAGIFWTAQGAIIMSYPSENQKGRAAGIFGVIFNIGGALGSLIPFGLNFHPDGGSISTITYYILIALMFFGATLGLSLVPSEKVLREDGSHVLTSKYISARHEAIEILKLFKDKDMLLLFPMFVSSSCPYAYQYGAVNAVLFNIRTRSFNNAFYSMTQMVGAYVIGLWLDCPRFGRRIRALYGLAMISVLATATWSGRLILQLQYTRDDHPRDIDFIKGPDFGGKFALYLCYGLLNSVTHTYVFWLMGALSNHENVLSRYTGYYVGMQSVGGVLSWSIDATGYPFLAQLIINWVLCTISFPFTYAIARHVKNTSDEDQESVHSKLLIVPSAKS